MSAATQELESFVREALTRGASRPSIAGALATAGWPPELVRDALDTFAEVEFALPVPKPRPYLSAREAFLYLVLFATLYFCAYNLGSLLFDLINLAFPDPAMQDQSVHLGRSMRWSTAAVIIAFPVFVLVARRLSGEIARQPVKRLSAVRRWLTYLTLFVAATVLIGDMTTLVYNLLGGELSARFLLKVLVAALIAGSIFGYYLLDLRQDEQAP